MHCNLMCHKYAKLLAVLGTTYIIIACLVLTDKITCSTAIVHEGIVSGDMTPDMHPSAASVAPPKQTSVRATVQVVELHFGDAERGYAL